VQLTKMWCVGQGALKSPHWSLPREASAKSLEVNLKNLEVLANDFPPAGVVGNNAGSKEPEQREIGRRTFCEHSSKDFISK
jgi:hypothetical protein